MRGREMSGTCHCSRPPNDSIMGVYGVYGRIRCIQLRHTNALPTSTDDPSTTFHVIARPFQSSLGLHNDHSRPLHASTTTVGHRKKREEGGNSH